MKPLALPRFRQHYGQLPQKVRELADNNYELLKADPSHAFLHYNRVGKRKPLWSARVGDHYRALGTEKSEALSGPGSGQTPSTTN